MRSTARAVPLVVLATAVLLGIGTNTVYAALRRHARPVLAVGSVAIVVVLLLVNFPALVDGTFYGDNLQRPEDIPQYWNDAAHYLDGRGDGRGSSSFRDRTSPRTAGATPSTRSRPG